MTPADRDWSVAHQVTSLLLQYPDEQLVERLPMLRQAASCQPAEVARPLLRFLDHLERTPLTALQQHYVETFDLKRKCCLFLTYYPHGDTRRRGEALLRFKQTYRAAGLDLGDDELPDHLAVVLEFAAVGDPEAGGRLLAEHRPGIELLRAALGQLHSPYADVVEAVVHTLGRLSAAEAEAAMRLAQQGPPQEQVGLEAFIPVDSLKVGGRA